MDTWTLAVTGICCLRLTKGPRVSWTRLAAGPKVPKVDWAAVRIGRCKPNPHVFSNLTVFHSSETAFTPNRSLQALDPNTPSRPSLSQVFPTDSSEIFHLSHHELQRAGPLPRRPAALGCQAGD